MEMDEEQENEIYNNQELESMLYARVHHDELAEIEINEPLNQSCDDIRQNSKSNKTRYWNQSEQSSSNQRTNSKNIFNKKIKYQYKKQKNENQIIESKNKNDNTETEPITPFNLKPFTPYKPIMENIINSSSTVQSVDNGASDGKNATDNLSKNNITNSSDNTMKNEATVTATKNVKKKNKIPVNNGPFKDSIRKLDKIIKIQKKKNKAVKSRNNGKKLIQKTFDIIDLDTCDEESQDVIEVKLPPPPLVTIDSSDDENDINKLDYNNFAKPKDINLQLNKKQQQDSSRCTTPCSIISDDFIGQTDRTGLLLENQINENDDDLNFEPVTVSKFIENCTKFNKPHENNINLTPIKKINNTKKIKNTDFIVSKENISGAVDVYESESDLTESVYSKGSSSFVNCSKNQKEIILSSDSDDDIIELIPKSKRFRKRRASSTNKDSEQNNEESTTDTDNDMTKSNSIHSFISKGEAVECYKNVLLPKKINTNQKNSNCSDNEFLSKLNSIVQGREVSDNDSNSSDDEENSITARKIAESVLNTLSNDKQIDTVEANVDKSVEIQSNKAETKENNQNENSEESSNVSLSKYLEVVDDMFKPTEKNYWESPTKISTNLPSISSNDVNEFLGPAPPPPNISKEKIKGLNREKKKECGSINNNYEQTFYVIESDPNIRIGWSDEQIKFYENSWGGENFNVNKIRKSMDWNARWTIYSEDRFPKYSKKSHLKCNNCSDYGHVQSKCPQPKKPLVCYMCGESGHREPRCPNTICLRCGNKTKFFTKTCNLCANQNKQTCSLCKLRGHSYDFCTDRWRRYHSTTSPNQNLNDNVTYNKVKYCCICAMRGHLSQDCRSAYRFSEYPLTCTEIKSHSKSYEDDENLSSNNFLSRNTIKYNLLYKPDKRIKFAFSHNTDFGENSFYGRFLKAVNLMPSKLKQNPITATVVSNSSKQCNSKGRYYEVNQELPQTSNSIKQIITNIENEPGDFETENQSEMNIMAEQNLNDTMGNSAKDDKIDSDSNYSFSEHFNEKNKKIQTEDDNRKISESLTNDSLPDFIPFNLNTNTDNEKDIDEFEQQLTQTNLTNGFSLTENDNENEIDYKLPDIPCVAKVILKNKFSEYLLSPEGNKFLIENSKECNVKASIDLSYVGSILIIEGLPSDQDKFHTKLLITFQELNEKLIRKESDVNLKVPKKRNTLIKFLSNDILCLTRNIGDACDIVKKLKIYEVQDSNRGLKMAEKLRKSLNMILYGQAGLKDGKNNLDLLMQYLKNLISNSYETVPNSFREKINISWKYIFSSQKNDDYEDMVGIYSELKRNKLIKKIEIDLILLKKCQSTQEQQYGNEQNRINNIKKLNKNINFVTPVAKKLNNQSQIINQNKLNTKYQKSTKSTINSNSSNNNSSSSMPKDKKYLFDTFLKENEKIFQKSENLKQNTRTMSARKLNKRDDPNNPSEFWSEQAIHYIKSCRDKFAAYVDITEKLEMLLNNAIQGLLSYNDYRSLINLQNFIK